MLGLFGVVILSGWCYFNDTVVRPGMMVSSLMPVIAYGGLILLLLTGNSLLRRLRIGDGKRRGRLGPVCAPQPQCSPPLRVCGHRRAGVDCRPRTPALCPMAAASCCFPLSWWTSGHADGILLWCRLGDQGACEQVWRRPHVPTAQTVDDRTHCRFDGRAVSADDHWYGLLSDHGTFPVMSSFSDSVPSLVCKRSGTCRIRPFNSCST